jgi:hypothetical protein
MHVGEARASATDGHIHLASVLHVCFSCRFGIACGILIRCRIFIPIDEET